QGLEVAHVHAVHQRVGGEDTGLRAASRAVDAAVELVGAQPVAWQTERRLIEVEVWDLAALGEPEDHGVVGWYPVHGPRRIEPRWYVDQDGDDALTEQQIREREDVVGEPPDGTLERDPELHVVGSVGHDGIPGPDSGDLLLDRA